MSDKITTFSMKSEVMSNKDFSQDDRFMHVKLSLCTHDQKANGVHFNRELLESKMGEIDFMPIVGAIKVVEKDDGTIKYSLGSHEVEMDIVDNELVFKKNTIVLGVALPNTAKFETIARHDDSAEYITFDALLFQEKYPQLKSIVDMETDASMELDNMDCEYDEDNGWYEVKDFRFLAHCLIGVPPAFKLAGVVNQFSMEDFKLEFSDILEEIKSSLDKFNENEEKGGNDMEETTIEIVEVEMESEGVEISEEETTEQEVKEAGQDIGDVPADENNYTQFELSHDDIRNSIWNQLNPIGSDGYREWNYWLMEVFDTYFVCQSESGNEEYYKFNFTKDQETEQVSVDMESKTQVFVMYLTQEEKDSLNQKVSDYVSLQEKFDNINAEYQAKLQQEEITKKQDIITSYSDSLTEEEINGVISDINTFSVEDIDIKLAAYLGKKIKSEKVVQKEQQVFANMQPDFSTDSKWASWLKKMN